MPTFKVLERPLHTSGKPFDFAARSTYAKIQCFKNPTARS